MGYNYAENDEIRVRVDKSDNETHVQYLVIDNQYAREAGWQQTPFYAYEFSSVEHALRVVNAWLEGSFSN